MNKEDEELANIMIDEADINNDGIISVKEFQLVMNTFCKKLVIEK